MYQARVRVTTVQVRKEYVCVCFYRWGGHESSEWIEADAEVCAASALALGPNEKAKHGHYYGQATRTTDGKVKGSTRMCVEMYVSCGVATRF